MLNEYRQERLFTEKLTELVRSLLKKESELFFKINEALKKKINKDYNISGKTLSRLFTRLKSFQGDCKQSNEWVMEVDNFEFQVFTAIGFIDL